MSVAHVVMCHLKEFPVNREETPVNVVFSTGPAPVPVPDVVGLAQSVARAAIIVTGLTVGNVTTEYSDAVPAGGVISQDPYRRWESGQPHLTTPGELDAALTPLLSRTLGRWLQEGVEYVVVTTPTSPLPTHDYDLTAVGRLIEQEAE